MLLEFFIKKILQKKRKDPNKLVAKTPDEDFIPYVCNYDSNTILTKNGELLQTIRVAGFSKGSVIAEVISLRDAVRDSLMRNVQTTDFAFWFNTIRRKKNISPRGEFPDFFSKKFNDEWVAQNEFDDQYVNELYVTIIIEGLDTSISNANSFLRSFSYLTTKALHRHHLEKAHKKLSEVSQKILEDLKDYGGRLLGMAEWEGVLYNEPMRFFGKIINLCEKRYPVVANDISSELSSHKMAFGDREMQVVGSENKNFAAMLSVKEYLEVSTHALDHILQLPFEFIITQSFDFAFSRKDLEVPEYQNYILQVSGDEDFRQLSGAANFIESKQGLPTDYGKLQTTIMVIAHTHEDLEKDIKMALEQLNNLGFSVVREDLFLEHCFWSQLPGNFRYLARQKIINTYRTAGFAALHSFPTGSIDGNYWGPAVCAMKTVLDTPYFFNFHDGDVGHSIILGGDVAQQNIVLNFLVTQSRRFNGKLFYFDFDNAAQPLFAALNGNYTQLDSQYNSLLLNPFALPDKEDRKHFLAEFFVSLVYFAPEPVPENEIMLIPDFVDRLITAGVNNFSAAIEIFNVPETQNLYRELLLWNGEELSYIFNAKQELDWTQQLNAFDLTAAQKDVAIIAPIMSYMLHRIENLLDGSPSILVLKEAWDLIDNPISGPVFAEFLQRLKSKNCVVIMTSLDSEKLVASEHTAAISAEIAMRIFLAQPEPPELYKTAFGLNDEEMEIIKSMEISEGHVFFKRGDDAVIAALNFDKMVEFKKTFYADELTLSAMDQTIEAARSAEGDNMTLEGWFAQYAEVLREIEKEKSAREKEKQRQERVAYLREMREGRD